MIIIVIGDIRSGNIQPSLTGNRVIDDALVANFRNQLADTNLNSAITKIDTDHYFDFQTADSHQLLLVDETILTFIPQSLLTKHNIIKVSHSDMLRGNAAPYADPVNKASQQLTN